jgi:uncharacterized protein (DUF433 family)
MATTVHYPHIRVESDRVPCLERWPRVRVAQIAMDHLGRAWSSEEISRQYPHLSLSEIHSALAYYFDHQQEIDCEIRAELRQADANASMARQSPLAVKLAALAH